MALGVDDFNGIVGSNVSGTSDLAPLDRAGRRCSWSSFPDAKNVGMLVLLRRAQLRIPGGRCRGVPARKRAFTVNALHLRRLQRRCHGYRHGLLPSATCIYIPTDNTAASCTEAINNVADRGGRARSLTGEEGICKGCGVATLSISYYDLGVTTGKMAVKILTGEADISEMPIEYYQNPVKKYMASRCEALGIEIPEGYEAIAE